MSSVTITISEDGTGILPINTGLTPGAQSFIATVSCAIDTVTVASQSYGGVSGSIYATIRTNVDATDPLAGTLLGTSAIITLPFTDGEFSFSFPTPITLKQGSRYYVLFHGENIVLVAGGFRLLASASGPSNPYPLGKMYLYFNPGGYWVTTLGDRDVKCKLSGTLAAASPLKGLRGKVWTGSRGARAKVWGTPGEAVATGMPYYGWRGWEERYKEAVPKKKLVKAVKRYIRKERKLPLEERLLPQFEPLVWELPQRAVIPLFAATYEDLWGDRKTADIAYECAQTLETILDDEEEELLMHLLLEVL